MVAPSLRPTAPDDRIESALRANDLPVADLDSSPVELYEARDDGETVGFGGLEVHGDVGLLRSVVVEEPHRGRGYGRALNGHLEDRAREKGVATLYLLTTDAADFFSRLGYEAVDRAEAPTAIRETAQFADLCPDTATLMAKDL